MPKKKLYISYKRRPIDTPKFLVEDGKAHFGTFNEPFKNINLLDCNKPCGTLLINKMNKFRLVEWEAFEVNMDEGTLVCAVYNNMSLIGMGLFVFFDKKEKKIYYFRQETIFQNVKIGANLLNTITEIHLKNFDLEIHNNLEDGKAYIIGKALNKDGNEIEVEMNVNKIAPCSNVCIPLGNNKPLYTEKDFFKAEGTIKVNGVTYKSNENTVAIIDDHKGYYPYKSHYDWLTTMGKVDIDGESKYFAINLTRNQSTNQNDYNENTIWVENEIYPLPPVKFTRDEFNDKIWYVRDKYGYVDIVFEIDDTYEMPIHLGVIDVSYYLPFGKLYGFVKDENNRKYVVDDMTGIGEDKSTRL